MGSLHHLKNKFSYEMKRVDELRDTFIVNDAIATRFLDERRRRQAR